MQCTCTCRADIRTMYVGSFQFDFCTGDKARIVLLYIIYQQYLSKLPAVSRRCQWLLKVSSGVSQLHTVACSFPLLPVVARSFQRCLSVAHGCLQFPKVSSHAYQLHTVACSFPLLPVVARSFHPCLSASGASQLHTVAHCCQ